jgi:hypothetical protein
MVHGCVELRTLLARHGCLRRSAQFEKLVALVDDEAPILAVTQVPQQSLGLCGIGEFGMWTRPVAENSAARSSELMCGLRLKKPPCGVGTEEALSASSCI